MSDRHTALALALTMVATRALSADEPAAPTAEDRACSAVQTAVAAQFRLQADDPLHPRWYCELRPLRDTSDYIVIVLRTTDTTMHVGAAGTGWYAVKRADYSVYEMIHPAVYQSPDARDLVPVPRNSNAAP